jgi:hypothetical protein
VRHASVGYPSYQFLLARFEAADTRLTALLTVVIGVTTAVPVFARTVASTPALDDVWFIAGLLFALVATGFGIVGRTSGTIRLVNPGVLYQTALHLDEWTFKKERVYFAGQHFGDWCLRRPARAGRRRSRRRPTALVSQNESSPATTTSCRMR